MNDNMKKNVEVFIVVICDQEPDKAPDPKLIASVREKVSKLTGIIETYLSPNTADIGAFASWEEKNIPSMVEDIKNIHGVNKVETKILVSID